MKKTVIFGGTFNPIHIGHVEMLRAVSSLDDVKRIIVIPTKIPPHKSVDFLASDSARLDMCRLAAERIEKAEVSDIELRRAGKSYTYETLCALRSKYPYDNFALCIGGDMLTSFKTWYNFREILKIASLFVFAREHAEADSFNESIKKLEDLGAEIKVVDTAVTTVSSSFIRENLNNIAVIQDYLSAEILQYIKDNNVYGDIT